jgi:hypothetical protein
MYDCAKDVLAYHDQKVSLPQAERTEMRDRRDANRTRLLKGLKTAGAPAPLEFVSQGSYAMLTMVQHPAKDYDIDDGAYFAKEDLVGPRGGDMSAREARCMVRDALDDGSFTTPPEVRQNCVRVFYEKGYHVDIPVYRRVTTEDWVGRKTVHYELASTDWTRSDARQVTSWFDAENTRQSPDTSNGGQMRRIVRLMKAHARSRSTWKGKILSGFGITKLVTERYAVNAGREDRALYDTMRAVRDRLNYDLVVQHPCTPNSTITQGSQDAKAQFLRDRLTEALNDLAPLFEADCTRERALKCWDKVFNTDFFSSRANQSASGVGSTLLTSGLLQAAGSAAQAAVRKEGGGRYA